MLKGLIETKLSNTPRKGSGQKAYVGLFVELNVPFFQIKFYSVQRY